MNGLQNIGAGVIMGKRKLARHWKDETMRKELPYFMIDGSYGGNQDWFRDMTMHMGGCAAASACDVCINLALHKEKGNLYPYNIQELNKEDYIRFAMVMKPYLKPRFEGIKTLRIFIDGFQKYLEDIGEQNLIMEEFPGEWPEEKAKNEIRKQIDQGMPIPYLLLRHKNVNMKDFVWHWFLLTGYEEFENDFYVRTATYGNFSWFSLSELWDTGYKEKGGMVILH